MENKVLIEKIKKIIQDEIVLQVDWRTDPCLAYTNERLEICLKEIDKLYEEVYGS